MVHLVYFSSETGNTKRFVEKLGYPAERIPIHADEGPLKVTEPYVLVVPTYGGGHPAGAVPRPVIKFLNNEDNRALIRGVIVGGNTNFGKAYGLAGDVIAAKCHVPLLYRFELIGLPQDVEVCKEGLEKLWQSQPNL